MGEQLLWSVKNDDLDAVKEIFGSKVPAELMINHNYGVLMWCVDMGLLKYLSFPFPVSPLFPISLPLSFIRASAKY